MQATFRCENASHLFEKMPVLHGIARAAVTGMGRIWADHPLKPRCAVATIGDFMLCVGEPGMSAMHLIRAALLSERREWLIYAPGKWADKLPKEYAFAREKRWAFSPEVQPEDEHLRTLAQLPAGMTVQPIEGAWIQRCMEEDWSRDFVREFGTDEAYAARGMGVLLLDNGYPVAGASSYVAYPGGMEVQVQTREGFEGRGYATVSAANLLLNAHENGLIATWDAANPASAHMAERLGYVSAGAYEVFILKK